MKPDLDSLIAKARAQQEAAAPSDDDFNQRVWRRVRMSGNIQRRMRWSSSLMLSNLACGFWCVALAVGVGIGFGLREARRHHDIPVAHQDMSVFSAESPSLPSSLLYRP